MPGARTVIRVLNLKRIQSRLFEQGLLLEKKNIIILATEMHKTLNRFESLCY